MANREKITEATLAEAARILRVQPTVLASIARLIVRVGSSDSLDLESEDAREARRFAAHEGERNRLIAKAEKDQRERDAAERAEAVERGRARLERTKKQDEAYAKAQADAANAMPTRWA